MMDNLMPGVVEVYQNNVRSEVFTYYLGRLLQANCDELCIYWHSIASRLSTDDVMYLVKGDLSLAYCVVSPSTAQLIKGYGVVQSYSDEL